MYAWNFCRYIPGTSYFAQHTDLMTGLTPITSSSFEPSSVQAIKDGDGKVIGVSYTRTENEKHCTNEDG